MQDVRERVAAAAAVGMVPSVWAEVQPDRPAVYDPDGKVTTWREVNEAGNRLARLFRAHGLKAGDSVALLCSNRAEFIEVLAATFRSGLRITPINWHLTTDEVAYVIDNCEAKALIAETRFPTVEPAAAQSDKLVLKVSIGQPALPGFIDFDTAIAGLDASDIDDPQLGSQMLYTSGTTGRPKGVYRAAPPPPTALAAMGGPRGYDPETDAQLCAGPAYHAAPLAFDVRASMYHGVPLTFIDKWDSEEVLKLISERKLTHMHLVPIMFQRLLSLAPEIRAKYDLSHVKHVIHGAAPCPPEVKREMIEWFGPVLYEYYAGSEGGAGFAITAEDWLKKPGSVGKRPAILGVRIVDENGNDCPPGVPGTIYHQLPPGGGFVYYKDDAKTQSSRMGDYFTMGDVGYFDEDDFLFLTGRNAETIISGGVNIYPQEIDNELIKHPAVEDSACVGIPNPEWGEEVRAVIQLKPGVAASEDLKADILGHARQSLPGFKIPRGVDFVDELPRNPAGKVQRNKVRAPYWEGRTRQI